MICNRERISVAEGSCDRTQLLSLDQELKRVLRRIYRTYGDIVTYEGIPYRLDRTLLTIINTVYRIKMDRD